MAEPLSNGQAQSLGAPSLGGSAEPLLPPAPSPVKNIEAAEMKAQPNSDEGVAGAASAVGVLGAPEEVEQSGNGPNEVQATVHTREADTGAEADAKREEAEEILIPLEVNTVQVPLHWHPKPCVHVTSIGGQMKEEELLTLFSTLGQVSSISFENERQDAAIVRYESSVEADAMVTKVRDALNNTKLGDRTLIVEPFRPDSFLFIGNLTSDIDDALLRKMFEPHGKIERAFVLYNAEGRSKGYGFVEFSLKGQATSAKMAMGNINMDGRVLRVEWSDCRKIADMFSTVLFIDRLPRDNPNVEQSLRSLFGQYGKVRDCHLAIGINQQFRGFGFVDFCHSLFADKAHQALDGHELEGSNIRVSFANPSKSAQSYKMRFGTQAAQAALGLIGRGAFGVPGMLMGPSLRGNMAMPLLASRLMGSARPGMLGMGIGMQFGRGTLERGLVPPLLGGGTGMLGPGSVAVGMMGRSPLMVGNSAPRAGSAVRGNLLQAGGRLSTGQGALPITSAAIAQVATAQAKAREEEAKARAEAAKQAYLKQAASEQQVAQQSFYQQQTSAGTDQQYKQTDSLYSYQQTYQQPAQQQTTLQSPYQAWSQQQQAGQDQQTYNSQYYSQPTQTYAQQQQATQYSQHDGYYQQSSQQSQVAGTQQQFGYAQQYGQQYSQQYGQQYSQQPPQSYGQTYGQTVQSSGQQYQQATPQQSQTPYMQQNYSEQYVQQQQQQPQDQSQTGVQSTTGTAAGALVQDSSQQGAVQAGTVTSTATASTTASAEQSYEAQWAAYYASQAAYQQQASYGQQAYTGTTGTAAPYYEQTSSTDVGQKRTADQMEPASQNQAGYNYPQVASTGSGYSQQAVTVSTPFQQPSAATATAYQQTAASLGYQQPGTTLSYQQPGSGTSMYQQPGATGSSGYEQATSVADGYQQQPATGTFQATAQGQTAVAGMYDYNNKRPRF